jgi:hypothetical protein
VPRIAVPFLYSTTITEVSIGQVSHQTHYLTRG